MAMAFFPSTPEFVPIVFDRDAVKGMAGKLSGSGGLEGLNAEHLQKMQLRYGQASVRLQDALTKITMIFTKHGSAVGSYPRFDGSMPL